MKEYRICKNDYDWFKLQIWRPEKKILFIKIKGYWKDKRDINGSVLFFEHYCDIVKFKYRLIKEDEQMDNNWKQYNE